MRFGQYEVVNEIARGGMGVVYRARERTTGRDVAVKVMQRLQSDVARQRFEREALAMARISHPGVVQIHACHVTPAGEPYLVMELVEGDSLQRRLDRAGPLPPDEAVAVALQLCDAVAACHAAGVLHRDLKPDNVLVDADGRLRLTDLGIARDAEPSLSRTQLTREGQVLGSPQFWSPEQASGQRSRIGERTDVYGLGATLFALLTGRPPHAGENPGELLAAVLAPKPRPSSLNPAVPRWLDQVVKRALAREPDARFGTIGELAAALRARGASLPHGSDARLIASAKAAIQAYAQFLAAAVAGAVLAGMTLAAFVANDSTHLAPWVLLVGVLPPALLVAYYCLRPPPQIGGAQSLALVLAEPVAAGVIVGALVVVQTQHLLRGYPLATAGLAGLFAAMGSLYGVPFAGACYQLWYAPRRFRAVAGRLLKGTLAWTAGIGLIAAAIAALGAKTEARLLLLGSLPLAPLFAAGYSRFRDGGLPFLEAKANASA